MDATTIATSAGAWVWKEFGEDKKGGFGEFLKCKFGDAKDSCSICVLKDQLQL